MCNRVHGSVYAVDLHTLSLHTYTRCSYTLLYSTYNTYYARCNYTPCMYTAYHSLVDTCVRVWTVFTLYTQHGTMNMC